MSVISQTNYSLPIVFFKHELNPGELIDYAFIGKGYCIESPYTVLAIRNTILFVTRWHYDKNKLCSYPCGSMFCKLCSTLTIMSATEHVYVPMYSAGKVDVPKGLICTTCARKHGEDVDLWLKPFIHYTWMADCVFDALECKTLHMSRKVALKWKEYVRKQKELKAIKMLKPLILHWAYRPDGPLVKFVKHRFETHRLCISLNRMNRMNNVKIENVLEVKMY
jgi:hypothetical protein